MAFECGKMSKNRARAGTGCSRRLSFSIDGYERPAFFFAFENYQTRSYETWCGKSKLQKQVHKGSSSSSSASSSSSSSSCRFVIKRARCSVARLFQRIRTCSVSMVQHSIPGHRTRPQPTSAASTRGPFVGMAPQSRSARFGDCHQAEAIEDCIKFLKNSSCKEEYLNTSSCQLQHLLHIQRP